MESLNIINKEDKSYYDSFFVVGIYPGSGAELVTFGVYANDAGQALELAVANAEINMPGILFDFDSIRDYVYTTYGDEYREWLEGKSGEEYSYDESWFEFAEEYLGYVYVDALEYGASQPYFVEGNDLRIEESNDEPIVFENKQLNETIQGVADIANKIRNAKEQVGKADFNYDSFVSEIKQDTMRLSDRNEEKTAATMLHDFCKEFGNKDKEIERESKKLKTEYYQMPEDEHIIWDSQIDYYDENYMSDIKNNQYQDYLDSLGEDEEPEDFESWYEGYIDDMSYDDARWLEEDLDENILPNIDNQLNDNALLLSGSYGSNYADFRPSGEGGVFWEDGIDGFKSYIGGFDRVCITTQNGVLGAICNDHDGTVSGQFYTLPDDKTELIKAMGYEEEGRKVFDEYDDYGNFHIADYDNVEEFLQDYMPHQFDEDLYYGGIDAGDLNKYIDLLKPVKDTISGYAPTDPDKAKTESKEVKTEGVINRKSNWSNEYIENDLLHTKQDDELWKAFTKFFRGYKGHTDWTDEEIDGSVNKDDVKDFINFLNDKDNELPFTESKGVKIEDKNTEDLLKEIADEALDILRNDKKLVDRCYGPEAKYTDDYYNFMKDVCNSLNVDYDLIPDEKRGIIDDIIQNKLFDTKTESKDIKTENNKIPRNWKKITYKSKTDTNVDKVGDTIEVERDEWNRPIATNLRTGKTALVFLDMIRNEELSEIVDIETADKTITESKETDKVQDLLEIGDELTEDLYNEMLNYGPAISGTKVDVYEELKNVGHSNLLTPELKDTIESIKAETVHIFMIAMQSQSKVDGCDTIIVGTDKDNKIVDKKLFTMDSKTVEGNKDKKVKTESLSYGDLEDLAKDIYDWYDSDMGTHFDEVQGNEESVYGNIMTALETKDQAQIQNFIDTIKEADISDDDAKATHIATTSSLVDRLSKLLADKKTESYEPSDKIFLDPTLANRLDDETKLNFDKIDLYALRVSYHKLDELVETIYDNRDIEDIEGKLKTILSRADVKVENLPKVNTVNEAFNLAQVVRKQISEKLVETVGYDALYEAKEIEYITQKELDDMPDDYKTTVGDTIKHGWEGREKLSKLYRDLGYEDTDPMIMVRDENGGTILKPVKVKKTENEAVNKNTLNEDDEETLDEVINRAHQEEISAIDTYDTVLSKTDETTDTKLVDMIKEIKADEEDHKLLLKHYIETGEALTDEELKELKDKEVIEENKEKKTEDILAGDWLTQDNKEEYSNGTILAELDIDPDYIEVDYENEDTDSEWLDKVFRTIQTKATEYDVDVMNLNPAPNGYTVILKGTLQNIVDYVYDQKNYSIDKCIEDTDMMVAKRPIEERLLGPSDEVIADSKAKGLYTEDDNAGAKAEIKKDLNIEPGSDEEAQLDSLFDEGNELSEEGLATNFKVGDVVTDIVDNDTAVIEAGPDAYDKNYQKGKYLLRFVDGVCKGDAYWYAKGRFELVKDEELIKDALETYNKNMKPEDNPLKTEAKYSDGYVDDLPQEYPEDIRNKYYEYVASIDLVDDEPIDFRTWVSEEYPDVYKEIEKDDNIKLENKTFKK